MFKKSKEVFACSEAPYWKGGVHFEYDGVDSEGEKSQQP